MKKFVIGFLLGAVLTAALPISAAVQQYVLTPATYPIIVDGVELNDPDYPVLNYNGTTYLSLRKTAEAVDADLSWNEVKNQVEIFRKADNPEYMAKLEQAALESLGEEALSKLDQYRDSDEFPVGARDTLLKFQMVKFRSDVIPGVNYYDGERELMEYNGEYYVQVSVVGHVKKDGWDYYIELPGKEPVLSQTGEDRRATENSFRDGSMYIKLSSLGLKHRIDGDVCWLEWVEE
ncbi:hypothetical protein A7W90_16265 [Clostridium sp. Bc-iso-3]|nr:hypothetical protein A7W90_16265 [Clostridium sp. Bc-iso-3]